MGSPPTGFAYAVQQQGAVVVIRHHGRVATTLRGAAAARFLADVERRRPATADGPGDRQLQARQRAALSRPAVGRVIAGPVITAPAGR